MKNSKSKTSVTTVPFVGKTVQFVVMSPYSSIVVSIVSSPLVAGGIVNMEGNVGSVVGRFRRCVGIFDGDAVVGAVLGDALNVLVGELVGDGTEEG